MCSFALTQKNQKVKAVHRSSRFENRKKPKRLKTRLDGLLVARVVGV